MIADPGSAQAAAAPTPVKSPSIGESVLARYRILLAEDGPDNQRLIVHILRKAGARVEVADDGRQALEAILDADGKGQRFDVVLMDMQMPVMDGYTAVSRLRQHGYTGSIIALTAHAMTDDCGRCIAAGCNGYASKPIDRVRLIESILQCHRSPTKA